MKSKPEQKTRVAYHYNECRDWLQEQYGYDERDYAGKWSWATGAAKMDESRPYQDFWHFVCDIADVHNGCYIVMDEGWLEDAEPWQAEIVNRYLEHFGRVVDGVRLAEFWVEW